MTKSDSLERRNYRKVYQRLWRNHEFRALEEGAKVLTLYLLTGPQTNRLGFFKVSVAMTAEDLGITIETVYIRLAVVIQAFEWQFDDVSQVLFIPSWWEYNPVGNKDHNLRGYLSDLNDLPRTRLYEQFVAVIREIEGGLPESIASVLHQWEVRLRPGSGRPVVKRSRSRGRATETVTKTETETVTETETLAPPNAAVTVPPAALAEVPARTDGQQVWDHYHERFKARYHAPPEYGDKGERGKYGDLFKKLAEKRGLTVAKQRVDAFFDSTDPFIANAGHTLGLFFSSNVQTKLIAHMTGPPGQVVSDNTRASLANRERLLQRVAK